MRELPSGTVTLLFTDIEGSTRMLQELGREAYVRALTEHRRLLREAFTTHGGVEVEMQGDSFHFSFPYARDAVAAAVAGQRALREHQWESQPISVRIGLHTGEPIQAEGLYAGLDVHRAARVMSAGHGGQILVSQQTAELVEGELSGGIALRDLGEHRLKDLSAPQRLYDVVADGMQGLDFPPLKTSIRANLPVPPTPLLGRQREVEEAGTLLRRERLVTLVGPGGVGKSRLALQLAADTADQFADGVWWVALQALLDPEAVLPCIAETLRAEGELSEHIGDRRLLLVLDNLEQLLPAAPALATLLAACPRLALLATSRESLRLAGEHEYVVPPLLQVDAERLFVERALAVRRDFTPTGEVAAICKRLEGLPLAVELAAARVKVFDAPTLLARLERSLSVLTTGSRSAPERQQTLRATIAWSHDLLQAEEQQLFERLGVFAGTFRLEAAEEICNAELDALAALVDKSLVRLLQVGGVSRFSMLGTVREYAAERLLSSGRRDETRARHLRSYMALAEQMEELLKAPGQIAAAELLELERENVRAALEFALGDAGDVESGARLAAAMAEFWNRRGYFSDGSMWLAAATSRRGELTRSTAAKVHRAAGFFAGRQGNLEEAIEQGTAALALYEGLSDVAGQAICMSDLGFVRMLRGDLVDAIRLGERACELARESGDQWALGWVLNNMACALVDEGEGERARALFRESRAIFLELGDRGSVLIPTHNLAEESMGRGDFVAAEIGYREEREIAIETGDLGSLAEATLNFAQIALWRRNLDEARAWLEECLEQTQALGFRLILAEALQTCAVLAALEGDFQRAIRVSTAVEMWRAKNALMSPSSRPLYELHLAKLAQEVDKATLVANRGEGEKLNLESAVQMALGPKAATTTQCL